MENPIDSDGKKVGTDVDPVEKSSPSVENRSEIDGDSVGGDGLLGSDELGKIESGERSFDSDEMRKDLNGVLFNKIVDSVGVEPALEKAQDFGRTKVGINGSCSLVGTFSQENKTSAGINWGRTGNGKMLEAGNGGIRSPSEISEELILGTLDDSNLYKEEMEGQPQQKTRISEEIKLECNGSPPHELEKVNERGNGIGKAAETSPKGAESPSGDSSLSPTTKGYGLKKWRRKRRDAVKDAGGTVDPNRILKRGLSNATEPVKGVLTSGKILGKSEGSVASMTSMIKNLGFSSLPLGVSDSESRLAKGSTFPFGTDSENSEDRSSKSSTATSIAKLRAEVPTLMGIAKDKNKAKNPSGRMSANAVQRGHQQGKGKVEPSKKLRGERAKTDNENSYSSVESDLRSSASVFTQMSSFAEASYEIERERSLNYDGENSDEGQAYEPQSSEEVRTGNFGEKGEDHGDVSKEEPVVNARGEKKLENRDSFPTEKDPLVESMFLLQNAQEALEKEIRKFGEIGKESILSADVASHGINLAGKIATFDTGTPAPYSSDQLHFEEMEESSSTPLETWMKELKQRINILECSLEEARLSLKAKESKVFELESILRGSQMPKDERDTKVECLKVTCKEMENELENMLMKKIEAELEYLTLSGTNQKWRAAVEDHIDLFEDQKTLAKEQAEMMHKLSDTRRKAILLEEEAKELEASGRELVRLKELLSARNNLCKSALFCFIQFVLICVVIGWFLLELLPPPPDFVPT